MRNAFCPHFPAVGPFAAAVLALATLHPCSALAQAGQNDIVLAPHRAVYDLKLNKSKGKRSLEAVRGRILYDFSGSACEGYSLTFRQVSELDSGEGKVAVSDLRSTTWEDGEAKSFRFQSQNTLNNQEQTTVDGRAERRADEVLVTLSKPAAKSMTIEGEVVFPTEHILRAIRAARDGKTILDLKAYDGSDNGEKVYNSLTVIGKPIASGTKVPDDAAAGDSILAPLTRWPVTVSYFEPSISATGEQTPVYAISFELYDNGVSRALVLDYGDFTVTGELKQLEMKDAKPCK